MPQKIATVFGATGFVGRHVVRELVNNGYVVRAATRNPQKAYFLRTYGDVGQIVPMQADMGHDVTLEHCIRNADVVVYLPGVLTGGAKAMKHVHTDLPARVAVLCAQQGVSNLVHISALACDKGLSVYAKTKLDGENAVRKAFPRAVILRPSIIFGHEDGFFARFAGLARLLPFLPLIGGGHTKFQPVYVGDVAKAVLNAVILPHYGPKNPEGRIYELGGTGIYSFKELLKKMFKEIGFSKPLIPLPFWYAKFKAFFLELLPVPPLTRDQVENLKTDNIVTSGSFGLIDLDITPTPLESLLPSILSRYIAGGPAAHNAKKTV